MTVEESKKSCLQGGNGFKIPGKIYNVFTVEINAQELLFCFLLVFKILPYTVHNL